MRLWTLWELNPKGVIDPSTNNNIPKSDHILLFAYILNFHNYLPLDDPLAPDSPKLIAPYTMSLRKACNNCTTSKRKCVVKKPKCTRCAQRNLECIYDLEPLEAPPTNSQRLVALGFDSLSAESVGVCIINTVTLQGPHIDPAICAPGRDRTMHITRIGFGTAPGLIRAGKPASFVHPKLSMQNAFNHFTALIEEETIGVHSEGFKLLIQLDIKTLRSKEALTALQVLLVHLEASAFSSSRTERDDADRYLGLLSEWTQALFDFVDTGLPKTSPWQDWLLGESKIPLLIIF
ncbi:hypothetical protein N7540_002354 [Penicillium herquei]|nr:hypothetical protein N7540_002354 [Penicillium herquei]